MASNTLFVAVFLAFGLVKFAEADLECYNPESGWQPLWASGELCREVPGKNYFHTPLAVNTLSFFETNVMPIYWDPQYQSGPTYRDWNGNGEHEPEDLLGYTPHMLTVETEEDFNFLTAMVASAALEPSTESWATAPFWLAARAETSGGSSGKVWKWTDGPAKGQVFYDENTGHFASSQFQFPHTLDSSAPGADCAVFHVDKIVAFGCGTEDKAGLVLEFESGPAGGGSEGDPHITGFLGQKFDFMGMADTVFAWYSDIDAQINFRLNYNPEDGRIYQTEVGVQFGKDVDLKMSLEPNYKLVMHPFDAANQTLGNCGRWFWTEDTRNLVVQWHGYTLVLERRTPLLGSRKYQHLDFAMSPYLRTSKEHVHGILGQTHRPSNPAPGTLMGEGVLEGPVESYVVKDGILGSKWAFNRFNHTDGAYTQAQCAALLKSPRALPRLLGSSTGGILRV